MSSPLIHTYDFEAGRALNASICSAFHALAGHSATRKTHFFDGRFENIYIERRRIAQLDAVLDEALRCARRILGRPAAPLKAGFWFNAMPPGSRTLLHRHDDYDELLSGVYYLQVPENSGDLVLYSDDTPAVVRPVEGNFVFFDPQVPHEVTRNDSDGLRLSLGMNIGPP
jgi:hypothetical protein